MCGRANDDVTDNALLLRQTPNFVCVSECACVCVVFAVMGSLKKKLPLLVFVSFIQLRLTLTGGESRTEVFVFKLNFVRIGGSA